MTITPPSLSDAPRRPGPFGRRKQKLPKPKGEMPDALAFLRAWAAEPLRVAAVAPSGPALAEIITKEIDASSAPVIELGPGTGVFTRALIARGVAEADLVLIEYGAEFARMLSARFPLARVLRADAARLERRDDLVDGRLAGAVISGLPILSMGPRKQMMILRGCFRHLKPDGALYQFTYGPRCPVPRRILERLGLEATRLDGTLRNIPPASVYRIARRQG